MRSCQLACLGSPPIYLRMFLDLLCALSGQLRPWSRLSPTCTCFQSSLPRSPQPQMWEHSLFIQIFHRENLLSQLWGFYLLLLCLHKEFPFLFFGHTVLSAQFWFWPCLFICSPPASVPHLGKTGEKVAAD